jgi:hypothetical protein
MYSEYSCCDRQHRSSKVLLYPDKGMIKIKIKVYKCFYFSSALKGSARVNCAALPELFRTVLIITEKLTYFTIRH